MAFVAASILPFSSCSDFLDREPITKPEAGNFLTGVIQVENYINGLYMTLPSFSKFGLGVRSEEKNSDNIIAEKYDARLHGQNNQFSGASDWQTGYQNLRKVNYFFHNYKVPEAQENEDVLSLKGEAYFLRAYWHFDLLKKFGSIPVMDAFWDENATIAGLQIPAKTRNEVARFILSDLVEAKNLLHSRGKYSGIRINKEAAMVLAMNVALYEGTWEKYHSSDDFASSTNESNYFLGEVINWGNELFGCGIDLYKTGQNPGDAFAALFNSKDLSGMGEVLLWRKYSSDEGVFHDVNGNLKAGVVDSEGAAGITQSLVDNYLNADGTFIDPTNEKFKDFKETFEGRDPRLIQTVMNEGAKFASATTATPMHLEEYTDEKKNTISPPKLAGDGNTRSLTGYHIRLGIDTTFVSGNGETALPIIRYAEGLLAYAEDYAMALLGIQYENGFFPGWLDLKTMQPMNHLNASPETSLSVTFLLKLYELTHKEEYKRTAFRAMNAVIHEIIPVGKWEDFETYWSCSRYGSDNLVGKKVLRNNMHKQNNFSMFWTAEALLECYRLTSNKEYLDYGQRTLDELLMTQASWQPPYMYVNVLGGFGVLNADGEWNDSRESLFSELIIQSI